MDSTELYTRIKHGENLHTEFKQLPITADTLSRSLVGFANTDGGLLILGVDDVGQVVGIEFDEVDRINQLIDDVAFNNCEPPITTVQETISIATDQMILIVRISQGGARPYRTNRGLYYVRTTSGFRQATREELLRLFQAGTSLYYDETPVRRSQYDDLDAQAIDQLITDVCERGVDVADITPERLLKNWHLLNDYPTLAGILLLAKRPQKFIPYAYITALRFPRDVISDAPIDQKKIDGQLIRIHQDAMRFLYMHLWRPHQIKGIEPEVKPELPVEALREVLVNALVHRDYTISAPIRLLIYENRIEIRTPGKLPNNIELESLKFGIHVLRNPTLYNMFLKIGLVTDAGSGIPRMISLIRQATGKEPEFALQSYEFVVTLPRPVNKY